MALPRSAVEAPASVKPSTSSFAAAAKKPPPFDYLAKTVAADESQRNALQQMQNTAGSAADTLASKCPKDIPAALTAKLDALKQGIDAFIAALDAVRPAVEAFYATLDDEQKARLVATYTANNSAEEKADQLRRASRNTYRAASTGQQELICEQWAGALREWPTRQIESSMTLSDSQHAALYDVTASIYRAAGSLIASCPAEASFTPLGQIVSKRKRVDALAQAIGTIRPPLERFADALDDEQKMRLARIVSSNQTTPQRRRSGDDD